MAITCSKLTIETPEQGVKKKEKKNLNITKNSCETSKMKCFAKMVNVVYSLTIFAKHFVLNI